MKEDLWEKSKWIIGILLALLLIWSVTISTSFFADDLGFDFAGYAIRYDNTFSGWFKNHHFGVPVSVFDGWIPGVLPLLFKFIGFGIFTSPLALSLLLMKLMLILGIMIIAREYNVKSSTGFLIGTMIAVNPITWKFLNRYYELTAWVFFLFAAAFILRYLKNKSPSKSLFFAVVFSAIVLISHAVPSFFLMIFVLFAVKPEANEIKKMFLLGTLALGLAFFWLGPFIAFLNFSAITGFDGTVLNTLGIKTSSTILIILLIIAGLLSFKFRLQENFSRETQLLFLTVILSLIRFFLPKIPLINKPFTHSFHLFYLIILAVTFFALIESGKFSKTSFPKKYFISIIVVVLIPGIFFLPKIIGNYSFVEPSFSEYSWEKKAVDFSEIDKLLKKIDKKERFEIIPNDPIIDAYATIHYDLTTAYAWGHNAFSISDSEKKSRVFDFNENCNLFNAKSKEFGINKWLAINEKGFEQLRKCGWLTDKSIAPALFNPPEEKNSIIENGKLLDYKNTYLKVEVKPPETLIKMNYFPKWKAYFEGKEIALKIEQKNKFIVIPAEKEGIVELKYEKGFVDYFSYFVSLLFLGLLFFIVKKKPFN